MGQRGVEAVQHEAQHKIQHGDDDNIGLNKKVALLIAILALFLSFAETAAKSAQTSALNHQIEAADLWNFFQGKVVRRFDAELAVQQAQLDLVAVTDPQHRAAIEKQISEWEETIARYRSDPDAADGKGEGAAELNRRATEAEKSRDVMLAKYHLFELGSAAFQIGIVLVSALVLTGLGRRSFLVGGLLMLVGVALAGLGVFAPGALHLH